MAKNRNYHRADVTLLQFENARLKEENAALAAQVKELKRKLEHMTEGLRQCPACAVRAVQREEAVCPG